MTSTELPAGFLSLGQSTAAEMARRAATGGRLHRTLLVHGPTGAGKSAFVDDLLALLFCAEEDIGLRPCNRCRGCRDARARMHPDLVIGSPERWREARSTGESIVAVARRWLLESSGAPVTAERRVVLVEGADRANEQIQNALLKALEEPAPRQMFLLVADEPARLLPTIRSRSHPLRIGPVPRAELVAWLMDHERLPADQAEALARVSKGMVGRAVGFARNPALVAWRRRTQEELLALLPRGRADRFAAARELLDEAGRLASPAQEDAIEAMNDGIEGEPARVPVAAQREAALLVVEAWTGLARDLLVAAAGRPGYAASGQMVDGLEAVATRVGSSPWSEMVIVLERIREGLRQNAAPRLAMEVAMLHWPSTAAPV